MVVEVNRAAPIHVEEPSGPSRLRPILKRIWSLLVVAVSGPGLGASGGIDDSAMPSGFMAPYRRGSRQVRNLWHLPF